ncbi:MAG: 23S rRNA (adenine(2503)-C(2))-methyltransferase RlmN [Rubrobacteridae bacterium]|nr:23S rRNA (adenine(2503)-C(2))-methyltransferase RlmN [Rubrobacteridae bacterium]
MNLENLLSILQNEPKYRLSQIKKAVFSELAEDWNKVTTLPLSLREILRIECPLDINYVLQKSKDGTTVKALITFADGEKAESVLMRHKDRNTICVSCQIGCPMGCTFCATGQIGFSRNLNSSEIVEQILLFSRILKQEERKINNVVFMGMGEPFLNYDAVIGAIRLLNDKDTLNIGMRRFSISTAGLISGIKKLADEGLEINLAVSLHAPTDELRAKIMPVNKKHPIKDLMEAINLYIKKTNRKVMIEYAMLKDLNYSKKHAKDLATLLKGKLCVVNLIPYNETNKFSSSGISTINRFKDILRNEGINAVQRYRFGEDIDAACGQLAARSHKQ